MVLLTKLFQAGLYKGHLNTTATLCHVHNKEVKEINQHMEKSYKVGGRVTDFAVVKDRQGEEGTFSLPLRPCSSS